MWWLDKSNTLSALAQLDLSTDNRTRHYFLIFNYIHTSIYVYILKKIGKENLENYYFFFFNTVWKTIIINWYDSNVGYFQHWAAYWYSNLSFQDKKFCSTTGMRHTRRCAASKKWELWERLWQRSQPAQTRSLRELGIGIPKKLWISSWKSPLQHTAWSWHSYQITGKLRADYHDPTNSYL